MSESKEQQRREPFSTWFLRSGRRDGANVGTPRRILAIGAPLAATAAVYVGSVTLGTALRPETMVFRQFGLKPLVVAGILIAFALQLLRLAVLEYMAFSIYKREHVELLRGQDEGQLRQHYEATFGRDSVYHAPDVAGVLSVLVGATIGIAMVFSWR